MSTKSQKRKEMKTDLKMEKEKIKLSLFTNDIVVYIGNFDKSTK
jgi:hypothetical protein